MRLQDQFVGAMLGVMTGDALGRSAKEHTPEELMAEAAFGEEMIGGFYTEDTEMTINVAESLLAQGRIDPDAVADKLGQQLSPMRGYNPGALEVLYRLQQGVYWGEASVAVFEEGSFGMGAACRAVPVGLFYHNDLDALIAAAADSARITHTHPLGIAGAVTVALVVGISLRPVPPREMFEMVLDHLNTAGYGDFVPHLAAIRELLEAWPMPAEVVARLGNALTAQAVVPAALYSFLRHPDELDKALTFAVNLGGDADTIAAITGGMAGAYHGIDRIPARWVNALENEERGRDYVRDLAQRLHAAWISRR